VSIWIPLRDGSNRCTVHETEFANGAACPSCEREPTIFDEPEDIGPLPYIPGLRTAVEWERWFRDQADHYLEWSKSADTETGIVKGGDLAFKFGKLALQAAGQREAEYTAERQNREQERIENARPVEADGDAEIVSEVRN